MGLVYANIELVSVDDLAYFRRGDLLGEQVKKITVRALVDSGAYMLSINEEIRIQLDLAIIDEQEAELADGSIKRVKIAGPIEIRFKNRKTTVNAVVLPNSTEVLLGAIPMEDMDLLINQRQQELIVNPAHPYLAKKSLK